MNIRFTLPVILLLVNLLTGCATVKEMGRGFLGVSTKVLEDQRKDSLKKSFALSYNDCYLKVKDILNNGIANKDVLAQDQSRSVIYAEDQQKKMIAIYFSQTDTTPVGIFFTEEPGPNTLIEISSPSTFAKEEISKKIFKAISDSIKPKVTQETITDVKKEPSNK